MFITDFFRTMGRRWYLVVLGVAATVGLGVLATQQVPPTYEIKGSTLLLPPANVVGEGGNPYLELGGLEQVVDVLVKYLDSDVERERLTGDPPSFGYEVARDTSTSGPLIAFTVEDSTADGAIDAIELVLNAVPPALATLQESVGVPVGSEVTSMTLTADTQPTPSTRTTIRALVAAVAAGLLMTAVLVALVDAWIVRRRAGKTSHRSAATRAGEDEPSSLDTPPDSTTLPDDLSAGAAAVNVRLSADAMDERPLGATRLPARREALPVGSDSSATTATNVATRRRIRAR